MVQEIKQLIVRAYSPYLFILLGILLFSFFVRVYNLNYNSPFSDEAIYIVIGRLGIFQGDWWTYNASAWLAGFPYIYPPVTAIASMTGGILGSRFLNVIFGVLTVEIMFVFTSILSKYKFPYNYISGLIASALVAGATIALYTSRLATYDAPSFYFLFLGLVPLLLVQKQRKDNGRLYFYSSILLVLASLTKIIILVYLPLIFVYSFFQARKHKEQLHFWKVYFVVPLFLVLAVYGFANYRMLLTYANENAQRDIVPLSDFLSTIWKDSNSMWIFGAIGSFGFLITKKWKLLISLLFCSVWIWIPHFITQRALWTFEKQLMVTVCFLAAIAGIGITGIIKNLKFSFVKYTSFIVLACSLLFYWVFSYNDSQRFNKLWANSTPVLNYLADNVVSGNKVLVESGGTAVLAAYNVDYPTNITTFDWFSYHNETGEKAYLDAVKIGYFDMIELEGIGQQGDAIFSNLHNKVYLTLKQNYVPAFSQNGFVVYKRKI